MDSVAQATVIGRDEETRARALAAFREWREYDRERARDEPAPADPKDGEA